MGATRLGAGSGSTARVRRAGPARRHPPRTPSRVPRAGRTRRSARPRGHSFHPPASAPIPRSGTRGATDAGVRRVRGGACARPTTVGCRGRGGSGCGNRRGGQLAGRTAPGGQLARRTAPGGGPARGRPPCAGAPTAERLVCGAASSRPSAAPGVGAGSAVASAVRRLRPGLPGAVESAGFPGPRWSRPRVSGTPGPTTPTGRAPRRPVPPAAFRRATAGGQARRPQRSRRFGPARALTPLPRPGRPVYGNASRGGSTGRGLRARRVRSSDSQRAPLTWRSTASRT
ncbi:hypothetical protein EES47_08705 [Streptomyces sp. ADI98-12]|nr:hypothetical protein EES47_08705 [Streptomyces sp. ADI98-12]